jgi:hypothetical protein
MSEFTQYKKINWKKIAKEIAELYHFDTHNGESSKCADYPCDMVNYPIRELKNK